MTDKKIAIKIIKNLRQPLNSYYKGYYEKNNSLFMLNTYDLIHTCKEKDISIVGWFPLKESEQKIHNNTLMDVGIITQDNFPHDHDTYWCHASRKWIDNIVNELNKILEEVSA